MSRTLSYYNSNASDFFSGTRNADMHLVQDKFLQRLPNQASILDFGCGSGRDAKYFLDRGFRVTATDGSPELCRLASAFAGIDVKEMLFQELDAVEEYDGIWACASILHLPKTELRDVMKKMLRALKASGVIYTSFKYGEFEGERNGRYFTDFTEKTFRDFITEVTGFRIEETWITGDVRPGRKDERWLNLILRRDDPSAPSPSGPSPDTHQRSDSDQP